MKIDGPLVKLLLASVASMASAPAKNCAIRRKMREKDVVRAGKRITLIISSEDMDDIIRIIKSQENSGVLIEQYRDY